MAGGPRGNLLRGPEAAGVAVADLELHIVQGQHESVIQFHTQAPSEAQTDQLVGWATRVGHRRIWINDEVVSLQDELPELVPVATTCPCCSARWCEHSWDFWSSVVGFGFFPFGCPICGGDMPQWAPDPDASGRSWDTEFGALESIESEGGWG